MTSEQQSQLGTRIARLREEKNLTLGELERRSGVTKGYLSQLERGAATNPSLEAVRKIARGLDVPVEELLDEEGRDEGGQDGSKLPRGLREFVRRSADRGKPLKDEDVRMLLGIRYRGRPPRTAEDFAFVYEAIRRVME
jgi:transcriptional regulator with XRE-family HTH domain